MTARLAPDADADAPKALVTRLGGPAVGLPGTRERFGRVAVLLGLLFVPMAYACIELKPSQTVTLGCSRYVAGKGTSGTSGVHITLVHGEVVNVEMSRRADLVYGRIAEGEGKRVASRAH